MVSHSFILQLFQFDIVAVFDDIENLRQHLEGEQVCVSEIIQVSSQSGN